MVMVFTRMPLCAGLHCWKSFSLWSSTWKSDQQGSVALIQRWNISELFRVYHLRPRYHSCAVMSSRVVRSFTSGCRLNFFASCTWRDKRNGIGIMSFGLAIAHLMRATQLLNELRQLLSRSKMPRFCSYVYLTEDFWLVKCLRFFIGLNFSRSHVVSPGKPNVVPSSGY